MIIIKRSIATSFLYIINVINPTIDIIVIIIVVIILSEAIGLVPTFSSFIAIAINSISHYFSVTKKIN